MPNRFIIPRTNSNPGTRSIRQIPQTGRVLIFDSISPKKAIRKRDKKPHLHPSIPQKAVFLSTENMKETAPERIVAKRHSCITETGLVPSLTEFVFLLLMRKQVIKSAKKQRLNAR